MPRSRPGVAGPFSAGCPIVGIGVQRPVEATVQLSLSPLGPDRVGVLGAGERNLKMIREALGVHIAARDALVILRGDRDAVEIARGVIERLQEAAGGSGRGLSREQVLDLISDEMDRQRRGGGSAARWDGALNVYSGGRPIRARTPNQELYLEAMREHDLVFGIGPAGTGKTYLAVAAAVHLLRVDRVKKVILARPAVEAGEKLGFLPGGIEAKVNPYLRPLFDALNDMMDFATIRRFIDTDVVEVVPLAFMRGRTLNNAIIILDEAQNTTKGQMQMFLTRMGHGSKTIVTGDPTQIDLPDPRESGLIDAARRLARVPGIDFVHFTREDVVRHDLVQRIVDAYAIDSPESARGGYEPPAHAGRGATTHALRTPAPRQDREAPLDAAPTTPSE
jgi:phosphate starvation-inducible protein PhoH and related proteins